MGDFEKEVIERLSIIETEIKHCNSTLKDVDRMDNEITILQEKVQNIQGKINVISGAVVSIIISMAVAVLRFLLNI